MVDVAGDLDLLRREVHAVAVGPPVPTVVLVDVVAAGQFTQQPVHLRRLQLHDRRPGGDVDQVLPGTLGHRAALLGLLLLLLDGLRDLLDAQDAPLIDVDAGTDDRATVLQLIHDVVVQHVLPADPVDLLAAGEEALLDVAPARTDLALEPGDDRTVAQVTPLILMPALAVPFLGVLAGSDGAVLGQRRVQVARAELDPVGPGRDARVAVGLVDGHDVRVHSLGGEGFGEIFVGSAQSASFSLELMNLLSLTPMARIRFIP